MIPTIVFFLALICSVSSVFATIAFLVNTSLFKTVTDEGATAGVIATLLAVISCLLWSVLYYMSH